MSTTATRQTMLNSGVTEDMIEAGTAANIYNYFGLTWDYSNRAWNYDHGISSVRVPLIGPLSSVAAANREADFAELLKAAINVGSLAKGGPNLPMSTGLSNYQYTLDTSVDLQVLQILANLVDQADARQFSHPN